MKRETWICLQRSFIPNAWFDWRSSYLVEEAGQDYKAAMVWMDEGLCWWAINLKADNRNIRIHSNDQRINILWEWERGRPMRFDWTSKLPMCDWELESWKNSWIW